MKYWLPVIFWLLVIFLVSSIPSLKVTNNNWLQDIINNCGHLTEYAILAYLIFRPLYFYHHFRGYRLLSLNFFLPLLYAFSDEFHQAFVPGRTPDIHDILMDTIGISLTLIILIYYHSYNSSSNSK